MKIFKSIPYMESDIASWVEAIKNIDLQLKVANLSGSNTIWSTEYDEKAKRIVVKSLESTQEINSIVELLAYPT